MNMKRYVAPSAREALARIRQELGPDAVVVTTREVPGGVELMAARYQDLTGQDLVWDAVTRAPGRDVNEQAAQGLMAELKGIRQLIKGSWPA